jgi:hypothetical protein
MKHEYRVCLACRPALARMRSNFGLALRPDANRVAFAFAPEVPSLASERLALSDTTSRAS